MLAFDCNNLSFQSWYITCDEFLLISVAVPVEITLALIKYMNAITTQFMYVAFRVGGTPPRNHMTNKLPLRDQKPNSSGKSHTGSDKLAGL